MFGLGPQELLILVVIFGVYGGTIVVPFWKIYSKAGFSGWSSLVMVIPFVNIIGLFHLAFADWPSLKNVQKVGGVASKPQPS
jgi:hypothetical protein